jgi:hypothetical protein
MCTRYSGLNSRDSLPLQATCRSYLPRVIPAHRGDYDDYEVEKEDDYRP